MTPSEKEDKALRKSVERLISRVKQEWSFKKIMTFRDYLMIGLGYETEYIKNILHYQDFELDKILSFSDVKEFLEDIRISNEVKIFLKNNPPQEDSDVIGTASTEILQSGDTSLSVNSSYVSKGTSSISERNIERPNIHESQVDENYGLPPSEKEDAKLYWFQKKYAKELLDNIESSFSQYLVAKAGDGKTFMLGACIRRLLDNNWHKKNTISPWPIFVVTKASVVTQTKEVFENYFNIDTIQECIIVGVDQLRCKFGELFLEEQTIVEGGDTFIKWKWRPHIHPKLIVVDEGHLAKNQSSIQSQILTSFSTLPNVYMIWSSATPYTRICEAKAFCLSTKLTIPLGALSGHKLTDKNWSQFASDVAAPSNPEDYNQEAVNRLTDILDKHIVRVKGVKWQFNPINDYELIDFITPEGAEFYRSAEERFFRRKAKLEAGEISPAASRGYLLAIMTQYNIAAESNPDRARIIASRMYHDAQEGYAPVCAMKYKISISRIIKILMEEYGVKREQFSVIWGGSKIKLTKKAEAKKKMLGNDDLLDALEAEGIKLDDIGFGDDDVTIQESIEFPEELNLSTQNAKQRDEEKKNFLSGKTTYCFFSIKAGGVGLSLHHTDELCKSYNTKAAEYDEWIKEIEEYNRTRKNEKDKVKPGKVRRKLSGYAYEEDIPFCFTRPRRLYGPPAYSAIDVIQFLGRCARLTSLSNTRQTLLFFRGTIEERVAAIYSIKLKCLSKVIRNHESWESVILGSSRQDREAEALRYLQETGEQLNEENDDGHITDTGSEEDQDV